MPVVVRAGRTGSGSVRLRTDTETPSGSHASSTSTGCPTSPWRSTLVRASCTIRYTASCCPVPNSPGWPVSTNSMVRPVERIWSMRSLSSLSSGCGASSSLCRSCARRIRTSPSACLAVVEMVRSASSAASGSTSRAYRAPSACAITTASEWATTSCMSRAIRLRSCSTTTSCSARAWSRSAASCASRLACDARDATTRRPAVHDASSTLHAQRRRNRNRVANAVHSPVLKAALPTGTRPDA